MRTIIQTDHLPPSERLASWRAAMRQLPVPFGIRAESDDFLARMAAGRLGEIDVIAELSRTPHEFFRTRTEIGWSDPQAYRLLIGVQGSGKVAHRGHEISICPGDFLLCDTSLPMHGLRGTDGETVEWLMMTFPRHLLPLPGAMASDLIGTPLSGENMLRSLASDLFVRAANLELDRYPVAQRLAHAVLDLLAALLAHALGGNAVSAPRSRRNALILQVQDHITGQLGDPALSPAAIAAAHHISTRQLHRLFSQEGQTPGGWIRARRLEACHRDLADPLLADQPVHAIAARWGLRDPGHFSRIFRASYGLSPQAYRDRAGRAGETGTSGQRDGTAIQ